MTLRDSHSHSHSHSHIRESVSGPYGASIWQWPGLL
jgi:hypothetical protein